MVRTNSLFFPRSTFDAFLYASVGVEDNGMELSVVSALARFGVDPWQEAARLATLPQELAANGLRLLLDRLPEGSWRPSDTAAIAGRLVQLLPRVASPTQPDQPKAGSHKKGNLLATIFLLTAIALASVILGIAISGAPTVDKERSPAAVSDTLDTQRLR